MLRRERRDSAGLNYNPVGNGRKTMGRRNIKGKAAAYRLFDVTYEDGTRTSNRRIANDRLDQSFGDDLLDLALAAIQEQDDEIAQRSNHRRAKITSITES